MMLPFEDRFTRQRQLAEVGLRGQERIGHARVVAYDDVEAQYLTRAGVGQVNIVAPAAVVEVDARLENAEAAGFAAAAHRALVTLREIVAAANTAAPND